MELLHSMELFTKVVEVGSFTKAADTLQVSRPQVTLAIKDLENAVGARLLHRTTRKVTLTAEGEAFYERAKEILVSVADATSMFGRLGDPVRGRLRIDLPSVFGQLPFLMALATFSEKYPEVEIALGVSDRLIDLVAEGVDCALRIGGLANSSLIGRPVGFVEMVSCAAPCYLEKFGEPTDIEDLVHHRIVQFLSGGSRRALPWSFLVDGQEHAYSGKGSLSVNEANAYVQAAVAGFGLIQAPGFMVERQLEDGSLVQVLERFRPNPMPVSLVYPSRSHVAPQVAAFADWLQAQLPLIRPKWILKAKPIR